MGTKRSLIEVVYDEGYGDALLMHINHAFGTRDMRAERVLQCEPRLLAAADMLAALAVAVEYFERHEICCIAHDDAKAAIRKAKGE